MQHLTSLGDTFPDLCHSAPPIPHSTIYSPHVSGKVFMLGNNLSITDYEILSILEGMVTKSKGKADP